MKNNYKKHLCTIALIFGTAFSALAQCNELFISELVFARDHIAISGNSPIANSFALEIFNPSDTAADLNGYFIKLIGIDNSTTNINLSGNIDSLGKYTVAFTGSDTTLTQISDFLSNQLNYVEKARVELWNANGIIDRIGKDSLTVADQINIAAAIADPVNYLNTLDLNLTSLKNFTVKRKQDVTSGNPTFSSPASEWTVAPNGDISNIGVYYNDCSQDIAEAVTIGFITTSYNLTQGGSPEFLNTFVSNSLPGTWNIQFCSATGTTAICGQFNDFYFSANYSGGNCTSTFGVMGSSDGNNYLTNGNQPAFAGVRTTSISIYSNDPNVTVVGGPATLSITGNATGLQELVNKYQVSIYPNIIESNTTISVNDTNFQFAIINISGQVVKEGRLKSGTNNFDFSELESGFYYVSFKSSKSETFSLKMIKK